MLVASKSEVFFGTYYSTFSGYINRLRGYHAVKNKLEGFENGVTVSQSLSMRTLYTFLDHEKPNLLRHIDSF